MSLLELLIGMQFMQIDDQHQAEQRIRAAREARYERELQEFHQQQERQRIEERLQRHIQEDLIREAREAREARKVMQAREELIAKEEWQKWKALSWEQELLRDDSYPKPKELNREIMIAKRVPPIIWEMSYSEGLRLYKRIRQNIIDEIAEEERLEEERLEEERLEDEEISRLARLKGYDN